MKKLIINSKSVMILLALFLLLSTSAFARPVTDAAFDSIRGGLVQINNFFTGQQYQPYAKAIDFFFFSFLFIAVYMMGARYAFKEIKRPEQVIVILLGLMTAFLLVLADISATILLPYIHWLLYALLFILYWWLLKGIQNKFWRFVLALLLTVLTIALLQGLFDYLRAPEIPSVSLPSIGIPSLGTGGYFKDLFGNFGGVQLPGISAPGVPDYLKNMFGLPSVSTPGPSTLPATTTPAGTTAGGEAAPTPTTPWWKTWKWLLLLLIPLLWFLIKRLRKPKPTPPIPKQPEITAKKKEAME